MNKAYEEYVAEHPEELIQLNRVKQNSANIERTRRTKRAQKLKRIEECRRILNEKHTE